MLPTVTIRVAVLIADSKLHISNPWYHVFGLAISGLIASIVAGLAFWLTKRQYAVKWYRVASDGESVHCHDAS